VASETLDIESFPSAETLHIQQDRVKGNFKQQRIKVVGSKIDKQSNL
jgi:hypothetical protein